MTVMVMDTLVAPSPLSSSSSSSLTNDTAASLSITFTHHDTTSPTTSTPSLTSSMTSADTTPSPASPHTLTHPTPSSSSASTSFPTPSSSTPNSPKPLKPTSSLKTFMKTLHPPRGPHTTMPGRTASNTTSLSASRTASNSSQHNTRSLHNMVRSTTHQPPPLKHKSPTQDPHYTATLQRMDLDGAALIVQLSTLNKLLANSNLPQLPRTLAPGPPSLHDLRDTLDAVRSILTMVHHAHRRLDEETAVQGRLRGEMKAQSVRIEKMRREEERRERERASLEARCGSAEAALRSCVGRCRDLEQEMARVRKDFRVAMEDGEGGGVGGAGGVRGSKGVGPLRKWGLTCVRCCEVWRKAREEHDATTAHDPVEELFEDVQVDPDVEEVVVPVVTEKKKAVVVIPDVVMCREEEEALVAARAAAVAKAHAGEVNTEAAHAAARRAEEDALYLSAMAALAVERRREEEKAGEILGRYMKGEESESSSSVDTDEEEDVPRQPFSGAMPLVNAVRTGRGLISVPFKSAGAGLSPVGGVVGAVANVGTRGRSFSGSSGGSLNGDGGRSPLNGDRGRRAGKKGGGQR
ncbi:hypothetical protein BC829DRAFT_490473 [Chytridium lagenaria]|nr:hypothetical protein BC829DRAFT_490473 [Chytridium lagenaria]